MLAASLLGANLLVASTAVAGTVAAAPAEVWRVAAPNGHVQVELRDSAAGLQYRGLYDKHVVIEWSPIGVVADASLPRTPLSIQRSSATEAYELVSGKRRQVVSRFNILKLVPASHEGVGVEIAVSDAGFGFRHILPTGGSVRLVQESTAIGWPQQALIWAQNYPTPDKSNPSYEHYFERMAAAFPRDSQFGWAFPMLAKVNDIYVLAAESGIRDAGPGYHLKYNIKENRYDFQGPLPEEGNGYGGTDQILPNGGPTSWRTFAVGTAKTVVESTLVTDLSPVLDQRFGGKIPAWIKPGRVAWDWWNRRRTGSFEEQKHYIDAAHDFGWEYILVDANWNQWNDGNAAPLIKELVDYGAKRGVGIFLWYNSGGPHNIIYKEQPRDRLFDPEVRAREFAILKSWGVKGIKVDFWGSEKQSTMQLYLAVTRDAADANLMVNFHGATLPRGWERQFPNIMSYEAVRGAEDYPFDDRVRPRHSPTAYDHVTYAFARNVIGPMDYTPGIFEVPFRTYGITYGHQLALTVIFQSALQHFADVADRDDAGYRKLFAAYPDIGEYFRAVPSAWDETRFVEGSPDDHIVLARRAADMWYVAGITALRTGQSVALDLSFAGGDRCPVRLYRDGSRGDAFHIETTTIGALKAAPVRLSGYGGFVATIDARCKPRANQQAAGTMTK